MEKTLRKQKVEIKARLVSYNFNYPSNKGYINIEIYQDYEDQYVFIKNIRKEITESIIDESSMESIFEECIKEY